MDDDGKWWKIFFDSSNFLIIIIIIILLLLHITSSCSTIRTLYTYCLYPEPYPFLLVAYCTIKILTVFLHLATLSSFIIISSGTLVVERLAGTVRYSTSQKGERSFFYLLTSLLSTRVVSLIGLFVCAL